MQAKSGINNNDCNQNKDAAALLTLKPAHKANRRNQATHTNSGTVATMTMAMAMT